MQLIFIHVIHHFVWNEEWKMFGIILFECHVSNLGLWLNYCSQHAIALLIESCIEHRSSSQHHIELDTTSVFSLHLGQFFPLWRVWPWVFPAQNIFTTNWIYKYNKGLEYNGPESSLLSTLTPVIAFKHWMNEWMGLASTSMKVSCSAKMDTLVQ